MATRIAFSTHWPERMGDLAGKPTFFQERIWRGLDYWKEERMELYRRYYLEARKMGAPWPKLYDGLCMNKSVKLTTIRGNYDYWKAQEGKEIQPFYWSGKPYRSKQVAFCPPLILADVFRIHIIPAFRSIEVRGEKSIHTDFFRHIEELEGFEMKEHFWRWFDEPFNGGYLIWVWNDRNQ